MKTERSLGTMITITEDRVDPMAEIMVDKAILENSFVERVDPLRLERGKRVAYLGERMNMMARLLVILEMLSIK